MAAGVPYEVYVTMRNNGTQTWTPAALYRLGVVNDVLTWGVTRDDLGDSVAPGEEVTFKFGILAPGTPGHYSFQWRMVQELVSWFGETTPAVDVEVYPPGPNDAAWVDQTVESAIDASGYSRVSVTMRNVGTHTWMRGDLHRLAAADGSGPWGLIRIDIPVGVNTVPPGYEVTFQAVVAAPATPGPYTFQWQMVQENVEYFGALTPSTIVTVTP
jgi:hypothetical protein